MKNEINLIYKEPTIKRMVITPELAFFLLENHNEDNRPVSDHHVMSMARDMLHGAWKLNGQCICVDKKGMLANGQQRLWSVIYANKPIEFQVCFGVDRKDVIATIDTNRPRDLGETLQMTHRISNAKWKQRIARQIALLCMGGHVKMTLPLAREIITKYYKEAISLVSDNMSIVPGKTYSEILGAFAFVAKVNPRFAELFELKYFSGEGLKKTEGAHKLIEFMLKPDREGLHNKRKQMVNYCLTTMKRDLNGDRMPSPNHVTNEGVIYFAKQQTSAMEEVRNWLKVNGIGSENVQRFKSLLKEKKKKQGINKGR